MDTPYPAHAFHDSFEGGRGSGELRLTAAGFLFRSGEHEVRIPYDRARLTLGGASDRLVFIAHPERAGWSIYTSERAILRDPLLMQQPALGASLAAMRRKRLRNWAVFAVLAALFVAAPLLLLFNMSLLTPIAARQVPIAWEERLGKIAFGQYKVQGQVLQDEQTGKLLSQLSGPLVAALPDPSPGFEFHVARDPRINAFALPGGQIVLHSELIHRAESATELLGVLAHEMAHVTERHGTQNLIASAGIVLTVQALLGDAGGLLATLATAAPFLLTQKYSREFEREADEQGFALLMRAQIDPRGMLSFFEKMKQEEEKLREKVREQAGDAAAAALAQLPEFLSTHPATDARIARLRTLVATGHGPYRDLNPAFRALKERVRELEATRPTKEQKK